MMGFQSELELLILIPVQNKSLNMRLSIATDSLLVLHAEPSLVKKKYLYT